MRVALADGYNRILKQVNLFARNSLAFTSHEPHGGSPSDVQV
jgi:hypothetical protein